MFVVNEDNSIYATRGDIVFFTVTAEDNGKAYTFQAGDVVRIKVFGKKDAEKVVLQKDFPVLNDCTEVEIFLTEEDTKIDEVISKPKDYWYEVELNPLTNPQTIIGYDEDGPKVFKLFPEGADIPPHEPIKPEDIPIVDDELDLTSDRPVVNRAIARAIVNLESKVNANKDASVAKDNQFHARLNDVAETVATEQARLDIIISGSTIDEGAEVADIRVGADAVNYESAGTAVRTQSAIAKRITIDSVNAVGKDEVIGCWFESGYVDYAGTLQSADMNRKEVTTNFIPVNALDFLTIQIPKKDDTVDHWCAVSFYDESFMFLNRTDSKEEVMKAMPSANGYMRVSFRSYGYPYIMIVRHNTDGVGSSIIPDCHKSNYEYVGFNVKHGYFNSAGVYCSPLYYSRDIHTDYIPVKAGERYAIASRVKNGSGLDAGGQCHWMAVNTFDASKKHLQRISTVAITEENVEQVYTATAEVTVPAGAQYISVSTRTYDGCQLNVSLIKEDTCSNSNMYSVVKGVAHRGLSTEAPENTLPAYMAAKKKGFMYVECDVSYTKDNVGVLLHDNTIDRTSNGSGNASDYTLDELKAFDFGSWFGPQFKGVSIPTFREFIDMCRRIGLHPYIELKAGSQDQICGLYNIVREYGMQDKVTWISFTHWYLRWILECDPTARVGYVCNNVTSDIIATALDMTNGENEVFIDTGSATESEVKLCVDAGLSLEFWTLNDASAILALHPYVSGVTSDCLIAGQVLYESTMN